MAQRNPWDMDWSQAQPAAPIVTPLPRNPADVAREQREAARDSRAEGRDETRLGLTVEDKTRTRVNDSFNQTTKLANDYNSDPVVKAYRVAIQQLGQALNTGDGPQNDLSLTYAFAKAMDPESVVRESEQGMVTESQPWFKAKVEQVRKQFGMDGAGNFTPEARRALREQIASAVAQRNKTYHGRRQFYTDQAQAFGADPRLVVGEHDGTQFLPDLQKFDKQRNQDPATVAPQQASLADAFAREKSIPIPEQMQQAHTQYLRDNWGRLTPEGYVQFRTAQDEQFGFTPRPDEYAKIVPSLNDRAAQGGSYEGLTIPPVNAAMDARDRLNNSLFNNPVGAGLLGVADMTGGIDEAAALAGSVIRGTDYQVELDRANALKGALRDVSPASNMAGSMVGGLATGMGVAKFAPRLSSALSTVPGMLAGGTGFGAAAGALEGNANRTGGALMGGAAGLAGGLAGRYVAAPLAERVMRSAPGMAASNGVRSAINYFRPGAVEATTNAPVMDRATSRIVGAAPDIDQITTNLRDAAQYGLPYSLADAAPELQALGGAVTRGSVGARGQIERILEPRFRDQADRAIDAIDQHLAPITDIEARAKELRAAGNEVSAPYYALAGQERVQPSPEIMALLERPAGRDALVRARDIALNSGRNPDELGFIMGDTGEVGIQGMEGRFSRAAAPPDPRDDLARVTMTGQNGREFTKVGPTDMVGWLRSRGGLLDQGGELSHMGLGNAPRKGMDFIGREAQMGPLVSADGLDLDEAARAAWEAGFFPELSGRPDVNTFLDALRDTYEGRSRRFLPDDMASIDRFDAMRGDQGRFRQQRFENGTSWVDNSTPAGLEDMQFPPPSAYGQQEAQLPTFESLDLVKKGLDARINESADAFGNVDFSGNPGLQSINDLRRNLVSALDRLNPAYPRARAEFAKYAKRADALGQGLQLQSGAVPTRRFDAELARAQEYDANFRQDMDRIVPELRRGYATGMGDRVEGARLSANPWEAVYGSTSQQHKVGAMFPEGAPAFGRIYDLERDMAKTTRETLGGSQTAARLQADQQLGDAMMAGAELAGGVISGGATSGFGMALNSARQLGGDALRLGVGRMKQRNAEAVAPVLFNTDPNAALLQMDNIAGAIEAIRKRKADFARRGGMFGSVVGATALPAIN